MSHILEGKTIMGVDLSVDKMAICFRTTKGNIIAKCDAECCSRTWIENIELPVNGFPATVIIAKDIELNTGLYTQNGGLVFYGFKISTDKGDLIIDYRNESNGYYGGSLVWPNERFYGGVYGQNLSSNEFKPVIEDNK